MPKHSNDTHRERIVIIEDGADLTPDVVVREAFTVDRAYVERRADPWAAAPDADEVDALVAAGRTAAMRKRAA